MSETINHIPVQTSLQEVPEFHITVRHTGEAIQDGAVAEHRLTESPSEPANFDEAVQNFATEIPQVATETPGRSIKNKVKVALALGGIIAAVGVAGHSDQATERQVIQDNPANHIQHR